MIASAIGTLIMGGILSSYIMCVKGLRAVSNYCEIHTDGRYAIERFTNDMLGTSDIISFSETGPLIVKVPTNAVVYSAKKTVRYDYTNQALVRTDYSTGQVWMLATNIYQLKFKLYDRVGNQTTVLSTGKAIQLEMFLRKYTGSTAQTEDYLSARLTMRNVQ
jgi:hypothetical protein